MTVTSQFSIMTSSSIFFLSLFSYWSRNPEIGNTPVWVLPNIWRLGRVLDTKFDTNISNGMLLNVAKFQGYNFYRFWVIKGKPNGGGRGKITTPPPQTRVNKLFIKNKVLGSHWICQSKYHDGKINMIRCV